ncbi:Isochorismatase-like protein [Cordyceps fumosorosea ARSEF 2679]|uniref:Isochorismatase-like protein n=1 Tax=Cordyceps fumosorosea (strain ARSEF 2679) TaxID=1081104 RepID=A0A168BQZ2_CORFA|nr:Isochorismatase-like protein [Cordyceps fumosorosea ARSEF 2679]OAA70437.1 Isochorismatase-like protein [Cordyceps fumosorosea ARSEF 2679]
MSIPPENPAAYPPNKTALLLLDFHHRISLLSAARANGAPIVRAFDAAPLPRSKIRPRFEAQYMPLLASAPDRFVEWEGFVAGAAPAGHEMAVSKTPSCISALRTPELLRFLKEQHKVESVVVCGVITSGAVLSTAREAADLGFVTTVVEEGCWDYTTEVHEVVLRKVLPMTAWVANKEAALKLLNGTSRALEETK